MSPAPPSPTGGGGTTTSRSGRWRRQQPLFDLAEVQAWLDKQSKGQDVTDEVQLWQVLRGSYGDDILGGLADIAHTLAAPGRRRRPRCPSRRSGSPAGWRPAVPPPTWSTASPSASPTPYVGPVRSR
ncbi:hypothetical protein SHKM778_36160 [Streptomyces sp. KM77-8]|uniref:Uncharacterized protein n=1 Tax=Streptomyces haneummycinicus TaxID=3074435 RepID=A0AAT9HIH9_9ACTN